MTFSNARVFLQSILPDQGYISYVPNRSEMRYAGTR